MEVRGATCLLKLFPAASLLWLKWVLLHDEKPFDVCSRALNTSAAFTGSSHIRLCTLLISKASLQFSKVVTCTHLEQ